MESMPRIRRIAWIPAFPIRRRLADFNRHKSMGQEMLKAVHGVGENRLWPC